ncbi:WG repeat-containing protein [Leptospira sp. WS92.C1]
MLNQKSFCETKFCFSIFREFIFERIEFAKLEILVLRICSLFLPLFKKPFRFLFIFVLPFFTQTILHSESLWWGGKGVGIVDANGNIVLDPIYRSIDRCNSEKDTYVARSIVNNEDVFLDKFGNRIQSHYCFGNSMFAGNRSFEINGTLGVINDDGIWKPVPSAEKIDSFYITDNKIPVSQQLAPAKKQGKWGYVDISGNWIVPPLYEEALHFDQNGLASVRKDGKWGKVDLQNRIVVPIQFDKNFYFFNGIAIVLENGKYGLIDTSGRILEEPIYQEIVARKFSIPTGSDPGYIVKINDKWGLKEPGKEFLIPPIYEELLYPRNGALELPHRNIKEIDGKIYVYQLEGKYGLIQGDGFRLTEPVYTMIDWQFGRNGFSFWKDGREGWLHFTGKEIAPPNYDIVREINLYDSVEKTTGFLLSVNRRGLWALMDEKGQLLTEFQYEKIDSYFLDGLAKAKRNGKWGVLDSSGRERSEFIYENLDVYAKNVDSKRFIKIQLGGKYGAMDEEGKVYVSPIYDLIAVYNYKHIDWFHRFNKTYVIGLKGKYGIINSEGKIILPIEYDSIHANVCREYDQIKNTWIEKDLLKAEWKGESVILDDTGNILFKNKKFRTWYGSPSCSFLYEKILDWSILDGSGKKIFGNYDAIQPLEPIQLDPKERRYRVKRNDERGVVDWEGKEILPIRTEKSLWETNGWLQLYSFETQRYELFSKHGKKIWESNKQIHCNSHSNQSSTCIVTKEIDEKIRLGILTLKSQNDVVSIQTRWLKERGNERPIQIERIQQYYHDSEVSFVAANFFCVEHQNEKYSLMNSRGTFLTKAIYDRCMLQYSKDRFFATLKDRVVFLDLQGRRLNRTEQKMDIWNVERDLPVSKKDGIGVQVSTTQGNRHGVLDENGKLLIPVKYDEIRWSEPYFLLKKSNTWTVSEILNGNIRKVLFTTVADEIDVLSHHWFRIRNQNQWKIVDRFGKPRSKQTYDEFRTITSGWTVYRIGSLWGIYSEEGNILAEPIYDKIVPLDGSLSLDPKKSIPFWSKATIKGKVVTIDSKGRPILTQEMDWIGWSDKEYYNQEDYRGIFYSEGFVRFMKNGLYGLLDKNGMIAVDPIYHQIQEFKNGWAKVEQNGLWGLLDKNGKIKFPIVYEAISIFDSSRIGVKKNGTWNVIDPNGNIVFKSNCKVLVSIFSDQFACVASFRN